MPIKTKFVREPQGVLLCHAKKLLHNDGVYISYALSLKICFEIKL